MENTQNSTQNQTLSFTQEELKKEDIERYCRQIILPEFGLSGQQRLKNAKALIVGAGGLGSPCLMYLSGAGVGEIGIIDGDCVDTSNLHRQIIHPTQNKGKNKAKSASEFIQSFNPLVKINTYEHHFTNKTAVEIAENYDLLIDCTDNPATRYLINDVCTTLGKPLVSGSAVKWEGQLTVYNRDSINADNYTKLPCYRCLFPVPSPTSSVCNCADAGVFGAVPGVIGALQSNEAVKLLLGAREKLLAQKMLMYDAYEMTFKVFKLRGAQANCEACGLNPKITKESIREFDYENFVNPIACRVPARVEIPEAQCLGWADFLKFYERDEKENFMFLDVRPEDQFDLVNLRGKFAEVVNCPLKSLKTDFEKCEKDILKEKKDCKIFVMCRGGNASTHATKLLLEKGYSNAINLNNGLAGYRKDIDNNVPIY